SFIQVDTPKMMIEYMKDGAYWAIVPISLGLYMQEENIAGIYPLEDPAPARTCYIVTRENSDEKTRKVKEEIFRMKTSVYEYDINIKMLSHYTGKHFYYYDNFYDVSMTVAFGTLDWM